MTDFRFHLDLLLVDLNPNFQFATFDSRFSRVLRLEGSAPLKLTLDETHRSSASENSNLQFGAYRYGDDRRKTRSPGRVSVKCSSSSGRASAQAVPGPYLIRANAISSFAWPSTKSVPFPGAHLAALAEVISEQITMFVSPVKQESLKVALPWVNRTLPAHRLANTWRFPPPKELLQ